ncbi:fibrinogen-like YCDxxxxGGGW domain-containing protein [Schaalia suimastitidis]|uniref:fibrinogen-like YCDxxxxGGGW domain-containing protein n=1 Tax=Schaalia suimastitidis TaxID=121163 RepID=UPI00041E1700|nr:fibrinogen-like YCDxxxxGGGW domain-containing protein [Schaalia suimastitidis]
MSIRHKITVSAAALGLLVTSVVALTPQSTAAPVQRDGLSEATAAASCWEIKRNNPSSPDGTYWLLTSTMDKPEQFFCDQTTDGGGWVLIGRGREKWDIERHGVGDPAQLQKRDRTPQAFATVQHSEKTINGLLGGTAVHDLSDGIRVVRATNAAGTSWQKVDIRPSNMREWVWPFNSFGTAQYRFDNGRWYSGARLNEEFGVSSAWHYNSNLERVNMGSTLRKIHLRGFAYGSWFNGGSSSSTSYLWRNNSPVYPFAEVYLRPMVTSTSGFTAISDQGSPAKVVEEATVSDRASRTNWGVVGNLNGRTREGNAPVQAFAQIGTTMFVGGNFTGVQRGKGGTPESRTALAAFDSTTGEWIPAFNATFNNQVKALLAMPDGNLLAAGDFTMVNGESHVGTVLLNPVDGSTVSSWDLQVSNRLRSSGGVVSVRALGLADDKVYLGGSFTHLSGKGANNVYGRAAARVDLAGKPDRNWNPEFNGTLMDLDIKSGSGRFYAAGYFTKSAKNNAFKAAAISTDPGAPLAVNWTFIPSDPYTGTYQQTVTDSGKLVFVGGAQHSIQGHTPQAMQRVSSAITMSNGGDFQASATDGNVVYAGCHCFEFAYENSYSFPDPGTNWKKATQIQSVGAWDAQTGAQYSWTPYLLRSHNAGAWALHVADDGALWIGGDYFGSRTINGADQWNGGWVRYPAQDRTAPDTPTALIVRDTGNGTHELSWRGVDGASAYHVLRDDRVIATVTEPRATVQAGGDGRYFVRAVDEAGNIGASTSVATPSDAPAVEEPGGDTPEPSEPQDDSERTVIEKGSTWNYWYSDTAVDSMWKDVAFDDTSWAKGPAPLGYGNSVITTSLPTGDVAQRPITTYYRQTFTTEASRKHTLTYVADDGAVVYVNGQEVSRERMPVGNVGHQTRANQAINTTAATAAPTTVVIPAELLRDGTNVITVETHLNYRSSPNTSFWATLVAGPQ